MSEAKEARNRWSKAINFVCDDNSLSADYIEELEKENAKKDEIIAKLRECVETVKEVSVFGDVSEVRRLKKLASETLKEL